MKYTLHLSAAIALSLAFGLYAMPGNAEDSKKAAAPVTDPFTSYQAAKEQAKKCNNCPEAKEALKQSLVAMITECTKDPKTRDARCTTMGTKK